MQAALIHYTPLVIKWDWKQVLAEIDHRPKDERYVGSAHLGLLASWARAGDRNTGSRSKQVFSYLEDSGWLLVDRMSGVDARLFVSAVGTTSFESCPSLASRFAGKIASSLPLSKSDLGLVLLLSLTALLGGTVPASEPLEILMDAILDGDHHVNSFGQKLNGLTTDTGNILLSHVAGALRPMNSAELSRWFQAVPSERHLSAPPEVTLHVLECAPTTGLTLEMVLSLRELAVPLLVNDEFAERVHQKFLAVCSEHPDQVAEYVQDCLEASPARTRDASEAFERLLSTGHWKTISTLLQWVGTTTGLPHTERLTEAAMFFRLVKEWQNPRGIGLILDSPDDFIGLRRSFNPAMSVKRADMLVAVIQVASERLNPRWLTPVQFEAEALCDAGRVLEAAKIANQIPDFRIGPRRVRLIDRIDELRREGKARTAPPSAKDYERILRLWFPNTGRRR
ncbi:hypothetical protein NITHO_1340001 [Nitrolancea hollandica Lb]|uniref:Uncharacterized protein n=2 Tax=Nitrolancea hollandica TaxID=1206749 RepID=I4ED32_9BACT|nr:hypothetical protein NITHO_1340001 [Nitrolancea hollandica Lb]